MKSYESKDALIEAILASYHKFIQEFEQVKEEEKDLQVEGVDRSPSQMISYQLGWLNLLMSWEEQEQQGEQVVTPTPEYKWNQLGPLYQSFYENYQEDSLAKQIAELNQLVPLFCQWVANFSEEELFLPEKRQWATTQAKWPIWKWVHINSVAPFTNFRPKIRKWKKISQAN